MLFAGILGALEREVGSVSYSPVIVVEVARSSDGAGSPLR